MRRASREGQQPLPGRGHFGKRMCARLWAQERPRSPRGGPCGGPPSRASRPSSAPSCRGSSAAGRSGPRARRPRRRHRRGGHPLEPLSCWMSHRPSPGLPPRCWAARYQSGRRLGWLQGAATNPWHPPLGLPSERLPGVSRGHRLRRLPEASPPGAPLAPLPTPRTHRRWRARPPCPRRPPTARRRTSCSPPLQRPSRRPRCLSPPHRQPQSSSSHRATGRSRQGVPPAHNRLLEVHRLARPIACPERRERGRHPRAARPPAGGP
mmetsp:Transcript_8247/g.24311  ORF Transcript_8247/g.24311 Transcript_8247/m.24311 type:complete len:265 (+) Transcript_8247:719-1513(+)